MKGTHTPDRQAAATAAGQHGVISRSQARAAGLTDRQIDLRLARGRWLRRAEGVFVVAGSPDTWLQRTMVAFLATGGAGTVSFVSSAAAYGLMVPPPLPQITVPPGRSTRGGVAKVHRSVVPAQDRRPKDGLIVTTPSRLLVDMATILGRTALEELTDDTLCRRLASRDSVLASLHRAGRRRRGAALLREVLAAWSERIEPGSAAEMRLLRLLGEMGLARLVLQHEVRDADGHHVATLDVAAPDLVKGLEYDSVRWHNPRRWERDEARYQRLRALGWDVEGVTKLDLVPGEPRLPSIVGRWLDASAA